MLARYYSQGYGRFLSPDPGYDYDQLDPMSWNLYAYVRGNPVKNVDKIGKAVLTVSLNISIGIGKKTKSFGFGVAIDDDGNVATVKSSGNGFSFPFTASIGISLSFTNSDVVQNLKGTGFQKGFSAMSPVTVGLDLSQNKKGKLNGISFTVGGTPKTPVPGEIHSIKSNSKVSWCSNVKDELSDIKDDAQYAIKTFAFSLTEPLIPSNSNISLTDKVNQEHEEKMQESSNRDEIRKETGKKEEEL